MNTENQEEMKCSACKYFESRTKFCRFNCPAVVSVEEKHKTYLTAAWPKISMPDLDWCRNFEKNS